YRDGSKTPTRSGLETWQRVQPHRSPRAAPSRLQSHEDSFQQRRRTSPYQQERFLPAFERVPTAGTKASRRTPTGKRRAVGLRMVARSTPPAPMALPLLSWVPAVVARARMASMLRLALPI